MDLSSIESLLWLKSALAFGTLEVLLQVFLAVTVPFRAIGDEIEYIDRGRSPSPFRYELFHRVPILPALAWIGGRTGNPTRFLRLASASCSVIAMAATAGAAARFGGTSAVILICTLLWMIPERAILGSRIWPDVYLAAATSGIALILTMTPSQLGLEESAVVLGGLVAFAVLVRIDALVLIPATALAWIAVTRSAQPTQILSLTLLPSAACLLWWLISRVALNEKWPDTTWIFNIGIFAQENFVQQEPGPVVIDNLIRSHQTSTVNPDGIHHPTRPSLPWTAYPTALFSRLRALLGPDTFVRAKIIDRADLPYPRAATLVLSLMLRFAFPLAVAGTLVVCAWRPSDSVWVMVPALSLMVSAVLFHTRTRFRLPFLYGMAPVLAAGVADFPLNLERPLYLIGIALATLAIWMILSRRPHRMERP